jgi:hypothetical protein
VTDGTAQPVYHTVPGGTGARATFSPWRAADAAVLLEQFRNPSHRQNPVARVANH